MMDNYENPNTPADPFGDPFADELANRLADQLDQMLPPGSDALPAGTAQDPLLDAAAWLASAPAPMLSPDAFARIQARILPDLPVQPQQPAPETAPTNIVRPAFSLPIAAAAPAFAPAAVEARFQVAVLPA